MDSDVFARKAVSRCGHIQGKRLVKKGRTKSLKGLKKTLFTKPAQWVFEMDVLESTEDKLSLDFHYCPLVKAWQKAGCSDEQIARLCDIAMCGDHGIGRMYDSCSDLPKCIAKGDEVVLSAIAKEKRQIKSDLEKKPGESAEDRRSDSRFFVDRDMFRQVY